MNYQDQLKEGMNVFSSDGKKLGKIVEKQADQFMIEKGFFFPKDYLCRYSDVSDIRDDGCHLSISSEMLLGGGRKEAEGGQATAQNQPQGEWRGEARSTQETRIPLAEEELEASRRGYQAGEVRIHKDVVTETQQVSVPLRHEQVRVERVPVEGRSASPGEASFDKSTTSVPIYEEEAEITKRPVVREELRVSKEGFTEERRASETVRKETADVEKSGNLEESPDKPWNS